MTTAEDRTEGLRMLLASAPDVAIIDIGLPALDGFALARTARAIPGCNTRLVALTGYTSPAVRQQALEAGVDLHIAKPSTPEKLASILLV